MFLKRNVVFLMHTLLLQSQISINQGKRDYQLVIEKVETPSVAEYGYTITYDARVTRYNSSFTVIKINATRLKAYPLDARVIMKAFEMLPSGRYSMVPMSITTDKLCGYIRADPLKLLKDLIAKSNFPTSCPLAEGSFLANDFYVDSNRFPVELPGIRWRIDTDIRTRKEIMFRLILHCFIDRNMINP